MYGIVHVETLNVWRPGHFDLFICMRLRKLRSAGLRFAYEKGAQRLSRLFSLHLFTHVAHFNGVNGLAKDFGKTP